MWGLEIRVGVIQVDVDWLARKGEQHEHKTEK